MKAASTSLEIIYHNPFHNDFFLLIDSISRRLMQPFKTFLGAFLACMMPTTEELKKPYMLLHVYILLLPVYAVLTALFIPLSVIGYIGWFMVDSKRTKFRISQSFPLISNTRNDEYTFTTANVCLLQDCLSRFNNLKDTPQRAYEQGRIIAQSQLHVASQNGLCTYNNLKPMNTDVLARFPLTDFLLIQEGSWDIKLAETFSYQLHRAYQYVVYDIAEHSFAGNFTVGTSGLMFASKYKISAVKFKPFSQSHKQCKLASKGLLQIKVDLGCTADGRKEVGYIFNTHLQVYQGTRPVQLSQMNEIMKWTEDFKKETNEDADSVIFDVLGGDFNFDNSSPVDIESYNHRLFEVYNDVGRVGPGQDHAWTRGTEMRQLLLHDDMIKTPQGLCHALKDDILMQTYILDGDIEVATQEIAHYLPKRDENGRVIPSPSGGRRRIDFLMPRKSTPVNVSAYNYVTALAGFTDHIPVSLTIKA